jgi:large subunit ribosomal protein L35
MPKMKTNRTAYKKFRRTGKGQYKRAQAYLSHNTAKKTPKRRMNLRKIVLVDDTNVMAVRRMLPYRNR